MNRLRIAALIATGLVAGTARLGAQAVPGAGSTGSDRARADELRALRRSRAEVVAPAKPSKIVEFLAKAENDGFDPYISWQHRFLRVGFGQLSPLSGATPAVRLEWPRIGDTLLKLRLSGAYSLRQYQAYELYFGHFDRPVPDESRGVAFLGAPFDFDPRTQEALRWFAYGVASYHNLPKERFYGIGPDSSSDARSDYRYETGGPRLDAGVQPWRWLGLRGSLEYRTVNVGPGTDDRWPDAGDVFTEADAPGVGDQSHTVCGSAGLFLGYQGDPNRPAGLLGLSLDRFGASEDGRFDFWRWTADARGFLPFRSRQRVIAARLLMSHDRPDEGAQIPFYLMNTLGGSLGLRSFAPGRFRDQNVLYLSVEYRWEPATYVDLALFYDTGKVDSGSFTFDLDQRRESWGLGVRFKSWWRTIMRFDVGFGDEGPRVQFAMGPAF